MINFPKEFTLGDENMPVVGSGLLQPSVNAQVKRTAPELPATNELQTSQAPKLASAQAVNETPTWIAGGQKSNSREEGVVTKLYLDTVARPPVGKDGNPDLKKLAADKRWFQDPKTKKWGILTAGSGYTTDENGNPWNSSMLGKEVTTKEKDSARYIKEATDWDKKMSEEFPKLWSDGSDKNKSTLRSFHHNIGNKYFTEESKSDLYKQMKEGNWNAIAFNVRSWSWAKNADGTFKKDANGKPIPKNPALESRRQRDEEGLKQEKKK